LGSPVPPLYLARQIPWVRDIAKNVHSITRMAFRIISSSGQKQIKDTKKVQIIQVKSQY
jgi:hypothetical protein